MERLPCSVLKCQLFTNDQFPPETDLSTKLQLLQIHAATVHPAPVAPAQVQAPAAQSKQRVKLDLSKLSAGFDQETWELFLRSWAIYMTGLCFGDTQASVFLFNCLKTAIRGERNYESVISQHSDRISVCHCGGRWPGVQLSAEQSTDSGWLELLDRQETTIFWTQVEQICNPLFWISVCIYGTLPPKVKETGDKQVDSCRAQLISPRTQV